METWKPIKDFEDYEVSSLGNVRRTLPSKFHPVRALKPTANNRGYLYVTLCSADVNRKWYVHRLVAQAFVPNPLGLPEVNHKGTSCTDNRADKLEWRSKEGHIFDQVLRGQRKGDGVSLHKRDGTWVARYTPRGSKKYKHLGVFTTKEEALAARKAAIKTLEGVI